MENPEADAAMSVERGRAYTYKYRSIEGKSKRVEFAWGRLIFNNFCAKARREKDVWRCCRFQILPESMNMDVTKKTSPASIPLGAPT